MSITFFYMRVFSVETMQGFRYALRATMAFVVVFGVSSIFTIAFQCMPVNYPWDNWDRPRQGHCVNMNAMAWTISIIDLTIDIWLLLLPMPQLWKLRMSLLRKLGVCLMFAAGLL
jgi:hypothetical protein